MTNNVALDDAGLTDRELDELAARALGLAGEGSCGWCVSYGAVHRDLIPEIVKRGLELQFHNAIAYMPARRQRRQYSLAVTAGSAPIGNCIHRRD